MLDKEKIRGDANIVDVAEELGLSVTYQGKNKLILCPAHNDRRIGSCFLTDHGFKCYSCGERGDVFKLVQLVLDVNFKQAIEFVAEVCGGTAYYEADKNCEPRYGFISEADQKSLGIENAPVYVPVEYTEDYEYAKGFREEGYRVDEIDVPEPVCVGYLIKRIACANPLYELYRNDFESFKAFIKERIEEKLKSLMHVFETIKAVPRNEFFEEDARETIKGLSVVFKNEIENLTKMAEKYGCGIDSDLVNTANAKAVAVYINSIWEKETEGAF